MLEEFQSGPHICGRAGVTPLDSNNPAKTAPARRKSADSVFRGDVGKSAEQPPVSNNPSAALVARARHELGARYLGRPLRRTELARLVGLEAGRHGGDFVGRLERGKAVLSGPLRVVLGMFLDGHQSPRHAEALRSRYGRGMA